MCLTQPLVLGQLGFNDQVVGRGFSRSLETGPRIELPGDNR